MHSIFLPNSVQLKIKNTKDKQHVILTLGKSVKELKLKSIFISQRKHEWVVINKSLYYKTYMAILRNITVGLKKSYKISLELVGVGYKAELVNSVLNLYIGYSHTVSLKIPLKICLNIKKTKSLTLQSFDHYALTQFVSVLKKLKVPDVYKGKGIKYKNELLVLKEGKKKK